MTRMIATATFDQTGWIELRTTQDGQMVETRSR